MKTVLITGASRGLGAALVRAAADAGHAVVGTARDATRIDAALVVRSLPLDLASEASLQSLADTLFAEGVRIDLLINNAGMNPKDRSDEYFDSTFRLAHFSAANVAESLHVNALMPMQLVRVLLPVLADDAVVLNVSSWLGSIGEKDVPGHYGYAGSKALLNMLTRGAALEWKDDARSMVALNPGWMRTDMGGENAKRTPDEVAADVLGLYAGGTLHGANGRFIDVDGSDHAW